MINSRHKYLFPLLIIKWQLWSLAFTAIKCSIAMPLGSLCPFPKLVDLQHPQSIKQCCTTFLKTIRLSHITKTTWKYDVWQHNTCWHQSATSFSHCLTLPKNHLPKNGAYLHMPSTLSTMFALASDAAKQKASCTCCDCFIFALRAC